MNLRATKIRIMEVKLKSNLRFAWIKRVRDLERLFGTLNVLGGGYALWLEINPFY